MRILSVSDIHLDYDENMQWLVQLSNSDYVEDVLILAGDISDNLSLVERCFEHCLKKFRYVFFVPGNHDIWVSQKQKCSSIDKFYSLRSIAQSMGVIDERRSINGYTIVPLFSWYDYSFGQPSDYLKKVWMDFRRCQWPYDLKSDTDVSAFFLEKNKELLTPCNETTISFSHFLPRIDVMPSFIPPDKQFIYPVLGSQRIDEQIRALNANIHIYGHSHVNRSLKIEGIHYLNNAFAYPNEMRISRKRLVDVLEECGVS